MVMVMVDEKPAEAMYSRYVFLFCLAEKIPHRHENMYE